MKLFMGLSLIIVAICGIFVGFIGDVTVDFPLLRTGVLEMSIGFGVFSIFIFLIGLYILLND